MKLSDIHNLGENELSRLCRVLAEPLRLRMLRTLAADGACSVSRLCEIAGLCSHTPVSQPTVSHHLSQLRLHRLVSVTRDGRWCRYGLADAVRAQDQTIWIADGPISLHLQFRPSAEPQK
jgi:DNA-binding transcriptional ArsR family regulator